jgi:hypothetical protein
MLALQGAVVFFTFEEDGAVRDCAEVRANGPVFGGDLVPGVFHTLIATVPDTVVYEVETGPYSAANDRTFASFAPAESTPEASQYLKHLRREGPEGYRAEPYRERRAPAANRRRIPIPNDGNGSLAARFYGLCVRAGPITLPVAPPFPSVPCTPGRTCLSDGGSPL